MDWYPLYNSLRIALISSVIVFFTGIFAAYYIARLNRVVKGILDVILTLPMVLPPFCGPWLWWDISCCFFLGQSGLWGCGFRSSSA